LISGEAIIRNIGTFGADANGEVTSGMNHKGESTKAPPRDGTPRSSDEVGESRRSEGGVCSEASAGINRHVVGDERALQKREQRVYSGLESCVVRREAYGEA
jgi:hypothetical protein